MICVVALALLTPSSSPQEELMRALRAYQKLDSYSAVIEHQDSSGLYPGQYVETLRWRKGGRFELKVVQKSTYKPADGQPGALAPDWFCDGAYVVWISKDKPKKSTPVDQGPNMMPGWEVSGGPVLSGLMKTSTLNQFQKLPEGITMKEGTKTAWKGDRVHELILINSNAGQSASGSFFITPDGQGFVGYEVQMNGKTGSLHYASVKNNPPLPENLGADPGK